MLSSMAQPGRYFLMKRRWLFNPPQPPFAKGGDANLKLVQKVGTFAMFEIVTENDILSGCLSLKQGQYSALRKSCVLTCWKLTSF